MFPSSSMLWVYIFVTKLMNNLFNPHKLVANGWTTEMWSCRLFFFFALGFKWYLPSFGTLKRLPVQEGCWEAGKDLARGYQDSKRPKTGVLWGVIVEAGLVLCNKKETNRGTLPHRLQPGRFRMQIRKELVYQEHSAVSMESLSLSFHSSYQALARQSCGWHNLVSVTVLLQAGLGLETSRSLFPLIFLWSYDKWKSSYKQF